MNGRTTSLAIAQGLFRPPSNVNVTLERVITSFR